MLHHVSWNIFLNFKVFGHNFKLNTFSEKAFLSNKLMNNSTGTPNNIVTLRLAPNLEKLSKLNLMNIQKENSDLKNEKVSTVKSVSTTDIERSVKDQDVSSGNYIDIFGSMQCPEQLQKAIREIE